MSVSIPRTVVNQILAHAQQQPEQEVCGLVGARQGLPRKVYRIANVARDTARLFTMQPQEQIDALRQMRERDETLFAIYHSHPHAPAQPSAADLAQAAYPDALYLIVSLNTEGVLEMRGYRSRSGVMESVELEVVETAI